MVRYPEKIPAGRIEHRIVSSLDIFATAASVVGANVPSSLDGVNLIPSLGKPNATALHDSLYWRVGRQAALRQGDWKLLRGREPKATWELYNVATDIGESENLVGIEPVRAQSMIQDWEQIDATMVAPLWGANGK